MTERQSVSKKGLSADWLVRGVLTKLGDTFDRFTGRRWIPSSSIATSELIERVKKLVDAEAKAIPGKGTVVPHNIKLRMQWDKFSTDSESALKSLESEMLVAVVDHINDSLYYTYAPVKLDVKPDYFIEGVKLMVSFEHFTDEDRDVEMNVTIPAMDLSYFIPGEVEAPAVSCPAYIARFRLNDTARETKLEFPDGSSRSVGRSGGNDLVLDHTSVSKTHASLAIDAEHKLSVADTGSTNGTFVNDERIAYGKAVRLADNERIRFGTVEVTFEYIPPPVLIAEPVAEEPAETGNTVEIDGFEFKGRTGPEPPDATNDAMSSDTTLAVEKAVLGEAEQIALAPDDETVSSVRLDEKTVTSEQDDREKTNQE